MVYTYTDFTRDHNHAEFTRDHNHAEFTPNHNRSDINDRVKNRLFCVSILISSLIYAWITDVMQVVSLFDWIFKTSIYVFVFTMGLSIIYVVDDFIYKQVLDNTRADQCTQTHPT